ncbi:MAG: gamma-glutamylcyclotransferase, partial [Phycisphaerae bacterium]|nr:gamma-glutamylcyclotransferase [Phycisphaerae bacterium]
MAKAQSNERASRANGEPFNLFVYGTLMDPTVFRAVMGRRLVTDPQQADGNESFLARRAVLAAYNKISPDRTYLYAVPDPQGRIHGYVLGPIPAECLAALRQYEGRNYRQARVKVTTADEKIRAIAFVGNLDQLSHSFGWEFRDHLKQEVLLRGKIEEVLAEDENRRLNTSEELSRRALHELHGLTIRDLFR